MSKSWIERTVEALRLIPRVGGEAEQRPGGELRSFPPKHKWLDWEEWEAKAWPRRAKRKYHLVPTTCFNCESACGLLAYVDKATGRIRRFEGNPEHPGSRGQNCSKGPATINQITDPERILYPMKRKGPRGSGEWERISWDQALDEIAAGIHKALKEECHNEVVYHVGRQGHEGYADRVLRSWGVDGHNSHTNICSSSARFGFNIWQGADRPSPDFANARFILLLSSHLETGHYFNPHAQRIVEAKSHGAELAVMDPRLSNTASQADFWMPTYPGSEAAVLLAMARVLLEENRYNRKFVESWVNWQEFLAAKHPDAPRTFETFVEKLLEHYAEFTPEYAAQESGVDAELIVDVARRIGEAGSRFATHNWRGPSTGNLGGWQVSRALHFICVLVGAVGTKGGTLPNLWNKFKPNFFDNPPPQNRWNELHFPDEYPLSFFELSQILPHMLKDGRGRIDTYFTRVFNPVWTYPDGFSWIEVLREEKYFGTHVALTPTWNETAYYADYVLPMGHAPERHDLNSYETHAGVWIAFRQPVLRRFAEEQGNPVEFTWQANPGEVWEEDEFWIELSWRIDPDGSLGIRKHYISPYREGEKITVEEYYRWIFDHTEGLPEAAEKEGLTAYQYMTRYGAFPVKESTYNLHMLETPEGDVAGANEDKETARLVKDGQTVGVMVDGKPRVGFHSPSRKQEFYSATMEEWGWPEYALPGYIKSHIHPEKLDKGKNEFALVPTFRLPNLIHSRSGNAKWLVEIAHRNPVWMNAGDAAKLGFKDDDEIKLVTDIGWFIGKVWATEALRPGVVACSHHIGRWKLDGGVSGNSWAAATVEINEEGGGKWRMKHTGRIKPYTSEDPDTERIFWDDPGVHQNITHAVHPDPISGMHCWHQRVRLERPGEGEEYGEVFVDTNRAMEVYREWLALTRKPNRPDGLRRPLWFPRPLRPATEAYYKKK